MGVDSSTLAQAASKGHLVKAHETMMKPWKWMNTSHHESSKLSQLSLRSCFIFHWCSNLCRQIQLNHRHHWRCQGLVVAVSFFESSFKSKVAKLFHYYSNNLKNQKDYVKNSRILLGSQPNCFWASVWGGDFREGSEAEFIPAVRQ